MEKGGDSEKKSTNTFSLFATLYGAKLMWEHGTFSPSQD